MAGLAISQRTRHPFLFESASRTVGARSWCGACIAPPEGRTPRSAGELRAKAKVCLVGANRGCKTSLVRSHVHDAFDDRYIVTLGAKVSKKEVRVRGSAVQAPVAVDLTIWDMLSERRFGPFLREAYLHGSRGILAVADMTRRGTLDDLEWWITAVQEVAGAVPVVVMGANHNPSDRQEVAEEEVRRVAETHGAACLFASASSEASVEEAFQLLADRIVAQRIRRPPRRKRG